MLTTRIQSGKSGSTHRVTSITRRRIKATAYPEYPGNSGRKPVRG